MSKLKLDYGSDIDDKYKNIYKNYENDIDDINNIQRNLMEYIYYQKDKLLRIEDNMSSTQDLTEQANLDLKDASNYSISYTPIIIGTILGGVTLTPALLMGLKFGSLLPTVGSLMGGLLGYRIQKI
tara:strand:- start:365 stop:742 length:378 start_codon:yes stop_codon:yes gene_type:complete